MTDFQTALFCWNYPIGWNHWMKTLMTWMWLLIMLREKEN